MITFDDFITKYKGKKVDFDGAYSAQCVDLAQFYNKEVIGSSVKLTGNAKDIWNTYPKDVYERIPNTPTGVPQKGDVMIWGSTFGGGYGHIGMVFSANVNHFTSFDQNYPTGSPSALVGHNYSGVLGWLRAKKTPMSDKEKLDKVQEIAYGGDNDSVARSKIKDLFK